MRTRNNQSGFSVVELVIVLAVVVVLGFVGYSVYKSQNNKTDDTTTTSQSATASDVPSAPTINSTSDLDEAAIMLDQTDTSSSSDSAQLDSELQSF